MRYWRRHIAPTNLYSLIRKFLFRLDAERAHHLSLSVMRWVGQTPITRKMLQKWYAVQHPCLETHAFGLHFANPVGLAAGYDKNGIAAQGLATLGFGHVEIGTLTRLPQIGNPKPRLFRVIKSNAIINSLGFPNEGVEAFLERTKSQESRLQTQRFVQGINIGKGKDTPIERAADDYVALLTQVAPYADYVTVNISSPNTLGLRQLQAREMIEGLLKAVMQTRQTLPHPVPVLVKIAPDLNSAELDDALAAIMSAGADGVIATNTTVGRLDIPKAFVNLKGGLSGRPLRHLSTEMIRLIYTRTNGKLPIIGVGGIDSADAAIEKIRAGASLVQVYTGMVFAGPSLTQQINRGFIRECQRLGVKNVAELRGDRIRIKD